MTERPRLDTACPEVLYARLTRHVKECSWCRRNDVDLCSTGHDLLKAWGDATTRETVIADEADRAERLRRGDT